MQPISAARERALTRGRGNDARRGLWMLSFESSDVAQVGGLGPAVANLAKALSEEYSVSIFMPSHGRH
ncbi:MAG: glycogen/starch synthase, partial [Thaumarchaeota archaeon]|nr:glycogen/starch synthase [Nitrososphaerota archaeon]